MSAPVSEPVGDLQSLIDELATLAGEEVRRIKLRAAVLGPSLSGADRGSVGARLRGEMMRRLTAEAIAVVPEHAPLEDAVEKEVGTAHNLMTYEFLLARKVDLLVVVPASPGSFCELGHFTPEDWACEKMVVLCDKEQAQDGSYIVQGPLAAASDMRAVVARVDYRDFEAAWAPLRREVERLRSTRLLDNARTGGRRGR